MKLARACIVLSVLIMASLTLPERGWAQLGSNAAVEAYNRGYDLMDAGRYGEAIPYFDEAIRLDPRAAQVYTNRGATYAYLGQHQRAIEDLDQAIRLDPRLAQAYGNRGLARLLQGMEAEAQKDFAKCFELDPGMRKVFAPIIEKAKHAVKQPEAKPEEKPKTMDRTIYEQNWDFGIKDKMWEKVPKDPEPR